MNAFKKLFKALLVGKWKDSYLRKLAIYDHLIECKLKYEACKLESVNGHFSKDYLEKELDKELVDLYILLTLHYRERPSLIEQRLLRFLEKTKNK